MSSEKQLILIILVAVIMLGYQWIKENKKKNSMKTLLMLKIII